MCSADVQMTRMSVTVCGKGEHVRRGPEKGNDCTYGRREKDKEGGVIPSADTIIHPLAVVITAVHAIITLSVDARCQSINIHRGINEMNVQTHHFAVARPWGSVRPACRTVLYTYAITSHQVTEHGGNTAQFKYSHI